MITDRPMISVIIPVYNVENYLRPCLESVLAQGKVFLSENINMEVICIEDASIDGSYTILEEYRRQDSRITIIRNTTHKGVSYSRNIGLDNACGDYIFFMDADDLLKLDALLELTKIAEKDKLDVVLFDADVIYDEDLKDEFDILADWNLYKSKRTKMYSDIYIGSHLFVEQYMNKDYDPCVWRQFFRREFLESNKLRFHNNIIHEDRVFTFQATLLSKRIKCISESYYIYRRRKSSITTNIITTKNIEGMLEGLCEMMIFWRGQSFDELVNQSIKKYLTGTLIYTKELIYKMEYNSSDSKLIYQNPMTLYLSDILELDGDRKSVLSTNAIKNKLQETEHVIVYGAGYIARRVLKELDKLDIAITGVAVTNKQKSVNSLLGNKVYEIHELVEYRNRSIVIIATSMEYQDEIEDVLKTYQFIEYIKV